MKVRKFFGDLLKADSIIDSLEPVINIGKFTGLSPYNYKVESGNSKISLNHISIVVSIVFIVIYTYCVCVVSLTGESIIPEVDDSWLLKIGDFFRIQFSYVSVMFLYILSSYKKHLYPKIVGTFNCIDLNFKLLGNKFNYKRIKISFFIAIVIQYLFQIFYMLVHYFFVNVGNKNPSFFLRISIYTPGLVSCLFLYVYQSLIHVSWRYLEALNNNIIRYMKNNQRHHIAILMLGEHTKVDQNVNLKRSITVQNISLFWEIYVKICDACIDINRTFSLKVLSTFTLSFVSLVFNLFHGLSLLANFNLSPEGSQYPLLVYCLHQTSLHFIIMSLPIIMCEICKKKANTTAILINKMLMEETDESVSNKLHEMSTHMLHTSPMFSGSGLFIIDNTLLFTIFGATTTYLVILIQFAVGS